MTRFETYDAKKHGALFEDKSTLRLGGVNFVGTLPHHSLWNIVTRRGRVNETTMAATKSLYASRKWHRSDAMGIIESAVAPVRAHMRAIIEERCAGHELALWIEEYGLAETDGCLLRRGPDGDDTWEFMIRAWFVIPGDTRPPLRDPDETGAVPLFRPDA